MVKLETYSPFVSDMLVPVSLSVGAWVVLPKVFRQLHKYADHSSAKILHSAGKTRERSSPYELSLFSALEDPCRLFATCLFLSQLGAIVAPTTIASRYLARVWSGGSVACLLWFLQRWKKNLLTRYLREKEPPVSEKERYFALDRGASLILLFIGSLGLAEAFGVAVQSLLAVGGIGGMATAFAARDVLGNLLSGVLLVLSKPFTVGDIIKAGNVEGRVQEVGMHSTRLLNDDKFPIVVPNSFLSSEVIVNKSRAPWRFLSARIPVRLQDFDKIENITAEVRSLLNKHPKVYLGEDKPRCSISRFAATAMEILVTANVVAMSNDEFYLTEQEILLAAARIITKSGAVLGGFL